MTNYINSFFFLALFMGMSCQQNLEENPLSFLEEGNSYKNAQDAVSAISGVYKSLGAEGYYGMGMINLSDVGGEECTIRSDGNGSVVEIDRYIFTSENVNFDRFYTSIYQVISRANRVISKVPAITMDTQLRDQIIGEAKFLRALAYFDLVRAFGDVPLITEVVSDVVNVRVSRTPKEEIYSLIVQDLDEASRVLPLRYTVASQIGRATSGAANALLAKVYLTNHDWEKARAKAKEVIDSGIYQLFPNYKDVFSIENKNGIEHIFSVQFSCVQLAYGSQFAKNFAIQASYPIGLGAGGSYQATETFESSYDTTDYRKAVTIIRSKRAANGTLVESRTGPHVDKYWDQAPCGTDVARNNFMVLRYADVLLMYAEALNELNGPSQEAYQYINRLRSRARNGNSSAIKDLTGLNKEEFREAVLQERSWELCFEGHRRWDLLRTGKFFEVMRKSGVTVADRHLLYPIPMSEIDVNPALSQNTDY